MNNLDYFKWSCQNKDDLFDFSDSKGVLVISPDAQKGLTDLQKAFHHLIDLIITYKTLKKRKGSISSQIVNEIDSLLMTQDLINYTPFCVYFQVLKYSYSAYKSQSKKMSVLERQDLLKTILDEYLFNRHELYMSYGYNDSVLQIMSDCATSRRKGKEGILKIEGILSPLGYKKVTKFEDFKKEAFCYVLPDKDGKQAFKEALQHEHIDFKFFKNRDAKFPDFLIKNDKKIFILEHKMTNGEGGSQNAEMNEIIDFIGTPEKNKNVGYISCLQGSYFTQFEKQSTKIIAQKERILKHLKKFPNNYFVNAKGCQKLFQEMK